MRITVFGAGAIGGYLAARLAAAGNEVAVVARGAHLAAIRERGLALIEPKERRTLRLPATDRPQELGPQDLVILALKAHAMPAAAPGIAALLGRDTVLLPAQNGIPWWYGYRAGGALEGVRLAAADPEGSLGRLLDPGRVIGVVVYIAANVPGPGVVQRHGGNLLILGEPDGSASERLARITALLGRAGLKIEPTPRIRDAIWMKLWGNLAFNPVSLLTGATMGRMTDDPGVRAVLRAAMLEGRAVGEHFDIRFDKDVEARIDEARHVGDFKTSMLQDYEAGRAIEIEALLGAVIELGRRAGLAMPMLEAIYALTRMRAPG